FTSGTTGKSKGVMLTQENLSENVRSVEYEASPGCVVLSVLPIHHAFCLVMDILKTLSLGCCVCLNDSLLHMVRNMGIFKPEVMLMVPLMIETIYKKIAALEKDLDKQSIYEAVLGGKLRIIFTGGAHLEPFYIDKFEELGVDVLEGYGMSECSPVITSNNPAEHKKGSIGKPLKNVEIVFNDGEILVRGSSVMKGYYKMPEETAAALEDGWLHTGDKGYIDEDGYLFINGRVKNLIIMSNGENVSPEEIENKLGINPLIKEVVITGENNGLTARIFPDPDVAKSLDLSHEELKLMLHEIIDEYNASQPSYRHVTALLIRKDPFARNTTGKIIRKAVGLPESELTG
ncbi:MAG: AMP-binding protein, partial [Blautia sp.]|nr:AMP-binding protein [Blautia sp.]